MNADEETETRWVLWEGGPEVETANWCWAAWDSEKFTAHFACWVAKLAGFQIPKDTYYFADEEVSQETYLGLAGVHGRNLTAILPLEME